MGFEANRSKDDVTSDVQAHQIEGGKDATLYESTWSMCYTSDGLVQKTGNAVYLHYFVF